MRKNARFLLLLLPFVLSLLFLQASCASENEENSEALTLPVYQETRQLSAQNDPFSLQICLQQQDGQYNILFLLAQNLESDSIDKTLSVKIEFIGDTESRWIVKSLSPSGGDFRRYQQIQVGKSIYTAKDGNALFGLKVANIPYGAWNQICLTISDDQKILFSQKKSYGTFFEEEATDGHFLASALPNLAEDWLSFLSDDKLLSQITIPGSHDSGAARDFVYSQTQTLSISRQLSIGVRVLDIRCRLNSAETGLSIYHGVISQNLTFDEVLKACEDFLAAHPDETILMSIKEEEENDSRFERIVRSYLTKNPSLWYTKNSLPTLGEVRGKIVLLRRFSANGELGINLADGFSDNTSFSLNNGVSCRIQDYYEVELGTDEKWKQIETLLRYANSSAGKKVLCINFTSGYISTLFGLPNITGVSDVINPQLLTTFSQASFGHYGLILSDFVSSELAEAIFRTNFPI